MSLARIPYLILAATILLMLIVLPQINISDYPQSTITSKFIVFVFGCLAILGVFALVFVLSKWKTIQISKLDLILILLVSYITINRYVFQPDYGFSIRYIELLGLSVLYIILRALSIRIFVWFLTAIIISGSLQAIYGSLQLLDYYPSNHSGFKLTGSFFNPGPYAGFLAIAYTINLGIYLNRTYFFEVLNIRSNHKTLLKFFKTAFEYILLLALISMVLVIPATHSRGAWLAVIFSSLFLLESHYRYIKTAFNKVNQNKKIVLAVLTVCILSAGVLGIYHFKKGSADGRLFLWKVTTEIIKDFPVTGVGFDRFKTHYMNYQANYFAEHGETPEALAADNSYYAFNDWLQFVTEQGVIGLILISLLIYSIFKVKTNKEHSYFYKVIGASIGAISLFAIVSYPMQILPIKFIIVVLLASLASIDKDTYTYLWSRNNSNQYTAYVFKTILICFIVFGALKSYGFVKNLNNAFKIWKSALTEHQYGDYDSAERYFQKAYQTLNRDGDFLMNYGKAMTMNGNYLDAVQILEDTKVHLNTTIVETALGDAYKGLRRFDKAEIAYKNAYNMIPIRFYPLYLQAKLYEESGQKEKAVSIAKVILNKDIKVYSTAIKEIKVEMENILKTSGVKNASF